MEAELIALLPRLRRMARSLSQREDEADDLVQATCERALAAADAFRMGEAGARLDSWLYRVMQNLWIDQCRRQRMHGAQVAIDEAMEIEGVDGRNSTEAHLTLGRVRRAMRTLPEDQRLALVLVVIEGLSYKEAAARLAVPLGTLMSRLGRARRRLDELVGRSAAPPQASLSGQRP